MGSVDCHFDIMFSSTFFDQIVHVLNVESNQLLAYPLKEENTLAYLQQLLELETKIPIAEQDILLASGISPEPHQSSMQCWSEPVSFPAACSEG